MKLFINTILALLFTLSAYSQQDLLEQANKRYADENYEEAISGYQEILDSAYESAELYFNLGNAYYKTGQYTQAIINYERAKLLAPNDDDISFNLDLANQHVVDAIDPLPQFFLVRWWNSIALGKTSDTWAKISVGCFLIFILLLGLFAFSRSISIKRISFWIGIVVLSFSILSWAFAAKQQKLANSHKYAIIIQPSVTVKSSPSDGGTDLFLIHEGLKVELIDHLGEWSEIKLADGNRGWLHNNYLEKI